MPARMRVVRCSAWLLAACALYATEPDRAVLSVMRSSVPDTGQVRVIERVTLDAELDIVVAIGGTKDWPAAQGHFVWWDEHRPVGILLQRRSRPDLIYKIAVSKGPGDCEIRVERATAMDVVVSCTPEKGLGGPNHRFVYDVRSKALIKQIEYKPISLPRIFVSGQEAVLVGTDARQLIAVKYSPADKPPFHLLEGAQAQQWTQRVETNIGRIRPGEIVGPNVQLYLKPKQFKPVRFGPGNRFTLIEENKTKRPVLVDHIGNATKRYPLPQSSYDEFAQARPARVRDGYRRQDTIIDETIGPWQIVNGTLWFAKTFYDGEGHTGVGGFGYFDTKELKYRIYSPAEIVDWSATAMLVEPEAVWLALASNGEYRTDGGGLLRFDRATHKGQRIEFREVVSEMACVGDHLLLATDFGAAVVKDHSVRRFFLDQTTGGQWQVSEAVFGK